ncbi:MAG: glycosyltransferase family 9 protein [Deltaproteobacteria bacterium]
MGKARLLVSVDTMAHHAAAALGVPTVVLWGRSKPEHFGYRRDNIINIQGTCPGVPVPARLCQEGTTEPVSTTVIRERPCISGDQWSMDREPCPIEGHPCMTGIPTRQVIGAMESLLSSKIRSESDSSGKAEGALRSANPSNRPLLLHNTS